MGQGCEGTVECLPLASGSQTGTVLGATEWLQSPHPHADTYARISGTIHTIAVAVAPSCRRARDCRVPA